MITKCLNNKFQIWRDDRQVFYYLRKYIDAKKAALLKLLFLRYGRESHLCGINTYITTLTTYELVKGVRYRLLNSVIL